MKYLNNLIIKEKKGELEVEDILGLVKTGTASLIPDLKILKSEIARKDSYSALSVPYDRWIEIVCEFLEHGYARLVEIAHRDKYLAKFAISALEAAKSREGFLGIITIMKSYNLNDSLDYKNYVKCISAINLMISFDDEIKFSEEESTLARTLIHNYLNFTKEKLANESDIITAYCALRKIGNFESLSILKKMPPIKNAENIGIDKMVMSIIKKRMK